MDEIKTWLSPQDVAKEPPFGLGISERTQAELRKKKGIPFSKVTNKCIRYDARELDKWLEARAVVSAENIK